MKPHQIMIAIGIGSLFVSLIQAVIAYQTLQLLQEQSETAGCVDVASGSGKPEEVVERLSTRCCARSAQRHAWSADPERTGQELGRATNAYWQDSARAELKSCRRRSWSCGSVMK